MNRCSASILPVLSLLVALLVPNLAFAEEPGTVKAGILYENTGLRNLDRHNSFYGNSGGVLLGYEKNHTDFWWAVDGTYRYGRFSDKAHDWDVAHVHGQGVVGKSYELGGMTLKPYAGLGFNWEAEDMRGHSDVYTTEYLLIFGARAERKISEGLVGLDLQLDYVLGREQYGTSFENSWGRRFFDGSYAVEAGVYYEPANIPVGIRPYFKYEKWQPTKYWYTVESHHIGIETYVKF